MSGFTTIDEGSGRGISDLIGFTLMFSIIITSVGIVSITGIDTLEDVRDRAQIRTAETSMEGVSRTVSEITVDGAPRRTVAMELSGGSILTRDSRMTIRIDQPSGVIGGFPGGAATKNLQTFVREPGSETKIAYTTGAIFRVEKTGSIVVQRPEIRCTGSVAYISLVELDGSIGYSGSGRVTLSARRSNSRVRLKTYPSPTVTADVEVGVADTKYEGAWNQLFTRELSGWGTGASASDSTYVCTGVDRVVVRVTTVEFEAIT